MHEESIKTLKWTKQLHDAEVEEMEVIQLEMEPFQGHGVRLCSDIFERVY